MKKLKILLLAMVIFSFCTCTKSPGLGGTSTIKGKVVVVDNINILGNIVDSYDAQDLDVFIIYGKENSTWF